jgi:hypothetical protein
MARRRAPLTERLLSWWRGSARMRQQDCLDDPEGAIALLQEEQGRLAQELEETFVAYDAKVQQMAKRLLAMGEDAASDRELNRLRAEQLELWRLVRRAQAAARSSRELQREVREWASHPEGAVPFGHPDHPKTRTEIVESELRLRGIERMRDAEKSHAPYFEGSARDASVPGDVEAISVQGAPIMEVEDDASAPVPDSGPVWHPVSDGEILRAIASREREMSRLLQGGVDEVTAMELAAFARELRELHTHLREHDRRSAVRRSRWQLGIPVVR